MINQPILKGEALQFCYFLKFIKLKAIIRELHGTLFIIQLRGFISTLICTKTFAQDISDAMDMSCIATS